MLLFYFNYLSMKFWIFLAQMFSVIVSFSSSHEKANNAFLHHIYLYIYKIISEIRSEYQNFFLLIHDIMFLS